MVPSPALKDKPRGALPEPNAARRRRLREEWGFTELEFREVVNSGLLVEIADTVAAGAAPQQARKWWTGGIARIANAQDAEPTSLINSVYIAEVVAFVESGALTTLSEGVDGGD